MKFGFSAAWADSESAIRQGNNGLRMDQIRFSAGGLSMHGRFMVEKRFAFRPVGMHDAMSTRPISIMQLLISWLVLSLAFWLTARLLPGFHLKSFGSAVFVAAVFVAAFVTAVFVDFFVVYAVLVLRFYLGCWRQPRPEYWRTACWDELR